MKDKKINWEYALKIKALALRSAKHPTVFASLLRNEYYPELYNSLLYEPNKTLVLEILNKATEEQKKNIYSKQSGFIAQIMRAESIIVTDEVHSYVEEMSRAPSNELMPFPIPETGDYVRDIIKPALMNTLCPLLQEQSISNGLIVWDSELDLGKSGNSITITAMLFRESRSIRTKDNKQYLGLGVTLFLDPSASGMYDPELFSVLPSINLPLWPYNRTLEQELSAQYVMTSLGEKPAWRIPNAYLYGWAWAWVMSFFQYLRERTNVTRPPGNPKRMSIVAKKLNLEPKVQIIVWRKEADVPRDSEHIPGYVDWSCRWSVKEHVRRYKSGKIVTIKSYIKGPSDKPLKMPNITINAAVR